jgi:hypothetical protein
MEVLAPVPNKQKECQTMCKRGAQTTHKTQGHTSCRREGSAQIARVISTGTLRNGLHLALGAAALAAQLLFALGFLFGLSVGECSCLGLEARLFLCSFCRNRIKRSLVLGLLNAYATLSVLLQQGYCSHLECCIVKLMHKVGSSATSNIISEQHS